MIKVSYFNNGIGINNLVLKERGIPTKTFFQFNQRPRPNGTRFAAENFFSFRDKSLGTRGQVKPTGGNKILETLLKPLMGLRGIILITFLSSINLNGQTIINSSVVTTYNTATEGTLYKDELQAVYIGMQTGFLKLIGNVKTINSSDGSVSINDTNGNIDLTAPTSKSIFDVVTSHANTNYSFNPPNTPTFVLMNAAIAPINYSVLAGDIIDVRLYFSGDYPQYNDIGDIIKFNITLNGSPLSFTPIEGMITGGDNKEETAFGSLQQMIKITNSGTLSVSFELKALDGTTRVYSNNNSGRGAMQLTIYR